jgi:hypothetical protein
MKHTRPLRRRQRRAAHRRTRRNARAQRSGRWRWARRCEKRPMRRSRLVDGRDATHECGATEAGDEAIQLDISLPSFGPISNSPELWWGLKVLWPLDQRYLYLLDFDASLDDGAWVPAGSAVFKSGGGSKTGGGSQNVTLEHLFGKISQAPHRVALRTTISFLDASFVPAQASSKIFDSSGFQAMVFINGPFQETWPDLRKPEIVRFKETRSSAPMSITLFDRYPSDFPPQVTAFPGPKPLESYFAPNRVQIIRLRLPDGRASGIVSEWPSGRGEKNSCTSADSLSASGLAAVELFGRMDPEIPVPLAAEAELYLDAFDKTLLTFPIVLGAVSSNAWWGDRIDGSEASADWVRFYFERTRGGASQSGLLERLDDQTASGHLILKPSRLVALRTQSFDRYYGRPLSIPVKIETATVKGRWIDLKDCPKR